MNDLGVDDDLDSTSKVWSLKKLINMNFIKIKNFSVKDNVKRMRRQATAWENIFAKDTSLYIQNTQKTLKTKQ